MRRRLKESGGKGFGHLMTGMPAPSQPSRLLLLHSSTMLRSHSGHTRQPAASQISLPLSTAGSSACSNLDSHTRAGPSPALPTACTRRPRRISRTIGTGRWLPSMSASRFSRGICGVSFESCLRQRQFLASQSR
jgi:hypothetical protein